MEQQSNPFATPAGNPFYAAPSVAHDPPAMAGGNPFDPFATPSVSAAYPFGAGPGVQVIPTPSPADIANPFGVVSQQPQQQQAPAPLPYQQQLQPQLQPQPHGPPQQSAYAQQPPFGTPPIPLQHTAQPTQPFHQPPAASYSSHSPFDANSGALVASQQPSNPYAGLVAPQGNPFEQAIVPVATPSAANQWGLPPAQPAYAHPFAQGPPPPPQPVAQQQHYALQQPDPAMMMVVPHQAPQPQYPTQPDPMSFAQQPLEEQMVPYEEPVDSRGAIVVRQNDFGTDLVPGGLEEVPPESPVNKYSQLLAQHAPAGSAPLPKGDLVVKSGYVLSRISFRTIMMKKWKQCYWVQYGPHTMLWFRSHADFDDWLNNPYLTQNQRNYLIKLAVNFVHDLYKPNVRGYQVTQARSKAYGRKVLKQFKLERWMDYGPTIAAAFASQDVAEVDVLRETLVECMRNTPVGDGIRATGAVRQRPDDYQERGDDPSSFRSQDSQQSDYQPREPYRNDETSYRE